MALLKGGASAGIVSASTTGRKLASQCLNAVTVAALQTRCRPRSAWSFWWYWKRCQIGRARVGTALSSEVVDAIGHFRNHGFCTYADANSAKAAAAIKATMAPWFEAHQSPSNVCEFDGNLWDVPGVPELFGPCVQNLIRGVLGCEFHLFYGKAMRSRAATPEPDGSFLWHADGGPSTCIHLMLYLDDTDRGNGAIEFAAKSLNLELLLRSSLLWSSADRTERARRYESVLRERGGIRPVCGPTGTVILFWENLLHRAGWFDGARSRDALVFNIYPARSSFSLATTDLRKPAPYPSRPNF